MKIKMAVKISGGYNDTVYASDRAVADTTSNEEKLPTMGLAVQKIAAGATLEALDYIDRRQAERNAGKEKEYTVSVALTASGGEYGSKTLELASITMGGKLGLIEKVDYSAIAVAMERLETAILSMVYDLLVANEIASPMPVLVSGDEAEQIADLLSKSTSAEDVALTIRNAVDKYDRAQRSLVDARTDLKALMAQMGQDDAPAATA
jgi:hypothetical protein